MLSSLTDTLARHHIANLPAAGQEGASLREALSRVPHPRARRGGRYPFVQLLQIIVHAVALDDAVNGWVRDVTFDEDRSQVRAGNAAHVMASLRNLAISIHLLTGATNTAKALRNAMRNPTIAHQLTGH